MITNLKIQNFKKFKDKNLKFSKGINVIQGKNEAGKSSIMDAIFTVLFTDANTKAQSFFEEAISWEIQKQSKTNNFHNNADIILEMNFLEQKGSYKLYRNFKEKKQYLKNETNGKTYEDPKQISKTLQSDLNIPTENVFSSTCFVNQTEITNIQFSSDLKNRLQSVSSVSKQEINLEKNIQNLEKELKDLEKGLNRPSKQPGDIKATQIQINKISQELKQKNNEWDKIKNAKHSGDESSQKINEINQKIQDMEELLSNHKTLEQAGKDLKKINQEINKITQVLNHIESKNSKIKQITSQIQALGNYSQKTLNQDSEKLTELRQSIQVKTETINELKENMTKLSKPQKLNYLNFAEKELKRSFLGNFGLLNLAFGISGILAGKLINNPSISTIAFVLLILGLLLILFVIGIKTITQNQKTKTLKATLTSEAKALKEQINSLNKKLIKDQNLQKQIIQNYNANDITEFVTKKAKYFTLIEEQERLKTSIEAYLNEKDISEIEKEQTQLIQEKKELEVNTLTPAVKASELSPNEYLKKRRELDMLLIEKKKLERDNTVSQVRTEEASTSYEEIVELEEELEFNEEKLNKLNKRKQLIAKTITLLRESINKVSKSATSAISDEVEKYLPKLTLNRYKDVKLTKNFTIKVFSSELNDWIKPLDKLSLGTVHQIFLISRIALSKVLLQGENKYLFLDDPFVTFDKERLLQMKQILQDISQETQVFLFTHNEFYKNWGELIEI